MARSRICSIPGCGKPYRSKGFCDSHYYRWLKYGSATAGGVTPVRSGGVCLTEGCDKTATKRGHCFPHYFRIMKYGDAHSGQTPKGDAERYFREIVLSYRGDDCLIWPFLRTDQGYALMWWEGRQAVVSRVVCQETYGDAPSPTHQAAHSCGKGHEGCVTKRHLRWATPVENKADSALHGTMSRGSRVGTAKLKESDIPLIRAMAASGQNHPTIAKQFGVTRENIREIVHRRRWQWLA